MTLGNRGIGDPVAGCQWSWLGFGDRGGNAIALAHVTTISVFIIKGLVRERCGGDAGCHGALILAFTFALATATTTPSTATTLAGRR